MANKIRSLKVFNYLNVIIPVPFSKQRDFQPVYFIADAIAYYVNKPIDFNYIHKKNNTLELKSIEDDEKRREILRNNFEVDLRYANKKYDSVF